MFHVRTRLLTLCPVVRTPHAKHRSVVPSNIHWDWKCLKVRYPVTSREFRSISRWRWVEGNATGCREEPSCSDWRDSMCDSGSWTVRAVDCQVRYSWRMRSFHENRKQKTIPGRCYAGLAKTLGSPPDLASAQPPWVSGSIKDFAAVWD